MKALKAASFYLLIAIIVLYTVFPFYYALVTSFKSGSALFSIDYLPPGLDLSNYARLFEQQAFGRNILNSVIVSLGVVALSLVLALTAAYALGRFEFRGRAFVLLAVLGVSMFPQVAVLSGMFELIRAFGLYNELAGLTLSYLLLTLPFTVWVLTAFMRELPRELEDAALVDGATPLVVLVRVFLPLLWPALVTTGLLAFVAAWNEFLFALTFTLTDSQRTVPVAIALMSGATEHELPWGNIMAASIVVTVPLIGLALVFQRRIVSGLAAGAVKG